MRRELEEARRDARLVYSADGEELGRVDAVYYDLADGKPEWLGVRREGSPARAVVPVEGVTLSGDGVRIPYAAEHVRAAPEVEAEEIGDDVIRSLAAHYGLDDETATAVLVVPEPEPPADERERLAEALRARASVVDPAGERLGELDAVYYDDRTGEPSWLAVRAERARSGRVLVPAGGASFGKDEVRVAHERALVEASPAVDGERIDARTDRVLRSHYGIDVPPEAGLELEWVPVEGEDSGRVETLPDGSVSIPVVEEQVVVSTRTVVRERVVVRRRPSKEG